MPLIMTELHIENNADGQIYSGKFEISNKYRHLYLGGRYLNKNKFNGNWLFIFIYREVRDLLKYRTLTQKTFLLIYSFLLLRHLAWLAADPTIILE